MKVAEAQVLVKAVKSAIDRAIADGHDNIDLTAELSQLDDAARAELEAAIKARGG